MTLPDMKIYSIPSQLLLISASGTKKIFLKLGRSIHFYIRIEITMIIVTIVIIIIVIIIIIIIIIII